MVVPEIGTIYGFRASNQARAIPHRIVAAVARLRQELAKPLHIDDLARELGMSVAGFHHRFRAVAAMSRLEFQKQLRLQEARRLGEDLGAASAGARVGASMPIPSQLSRCG